MSMKWRYSTKLCGISDSDLLLRKFFIRREPRIIIFHKWFQTMRYWIASLRLQLLRDVRPVQLSAGAAECNELAAVCAVA